MPPAISSFSPASGPVGTEVTITGTNFNTTAADNVVFFGATKATVTAATATSLTVTVPVGATYQYISVSDMNSGFTAYSAQPFVVTFADGYGNFGMKVNYPTGTYALSVAIGDLDGDGKPDWRWRITVPIMFPYCGIRVARAALALPQRSIIPPERILTA